ncbi:PREDICTED: HIV Tat-specific factor 1-like isoform X1 [Calidris pugnax]|uniref:HIV Tat-specific factor 1-like isoform X1 n=1 Tax=Calidris pugnax TaxID=198806 RepID=UPI00071D699F|nr:PREDICTED: HIV Tat-specific factor 1-like isoform X1 [Calidris pugnax]XP_014810618.1 PREDICTED: HIV Tat-specific factor 1-like isoform X1 [Calidris pugnax]
MRHERIVIIRNMFHPKDFEEDPLVLNEIREDLRTECEKFGQVKKVLIFDRHPDGVASVSFKEATEADLCKLTLNGRWFGGRQLSAETWDGVTDYQVEETAREREERLKVWGSFLEDPDAKEQQPTSDSDAATSSVKLPEGRQPANVNDTSKDVNDEAHKRENNGSIPAFQYRMFLHPQAFGESFILRKAVSFPPYIVKTTTSSRLKQWVDKSSLLNFELEK